LLFLTRNAVKYMEQNEQNNAEALAQATMLDAPTLFFYSLLPHHKTITMECAKEIWYDIRNKDEAAERLFVMYQATLQTLISDEEPADGVDENADSGMEAVVGNIFDKQQKEIAIENAPQTISEFFDAQAPYYIHYGMTADEYWNGVPQRAAEYRKAYEIKMEEENSFLHLTGQYNLEAFAVVMSDKKNKHKYPKRPYAITKKEAMRRKKHEEALKAKQQADAPLAMLALVGEMNKQRRERQAKKQQQIVQGDEVK